MPHISQLAPADSHGVELPPVTRRQEGRLLAEYPKHLRGKGAQVDFGHGMGYLLSDAMRIFVLYAKTPPEGIAGRRFRRKKEKPVSYADTGLVKCLTCPGQTSC